MKSISVTDLRLIDELKHLNYFELIAPENDSLVYPFLETMGFDLSYPINYLACQHRNLQNQVVINYLLTGEASINRADVTGEWGSLEQRLYAAAFSDVSLCKELCQHLNSTLNYGSFRDVGSADIEDVATFDKSLCNPNEKEILTQIRQLEGLLVHIRGKQE